MKNEIEMVNNSFSAFLNDYILNTICLWGFERFEFFDRVVDIISGKISLCFKGLGIGGGQGGREEGAG